MGAIALSLGVLSAGGCGRGASELGSAGRETPTTAAENSAPTAPSERQPAAPTDLPAVSVTDVATGASFELGSLAPADTATLLWLYAPH